MPVLLAQAAVVFLITLPFLLAWGRAFLATLPFLLAGGLVFLAAACLFFVGLRWALGSSWVVFSDLASFLAVAAAVAAMRDDLRTPTVGGISSFGLVRAMPAGPNTGGIKIGWWF